MAQDITSGIDVSDLVDATTIDAADALTPIQNIITTMNAMLNGGQSFDMVNFEAATELTIATGAITVTQALHTVDTESDAASDNLDTITMDDGDMAYLRAAHTDRTVVIRHGQDNIITADGADISLDTTQIWVQVLRSGSSVYVIGSGSGYTPADTLDWVGADPGGVVDALDNLAMRMGGRGYIVGLEISVTSDAALAIAEGECLDDTHTKILRRGVYAVNTGVSGIGGLDTGSVAADTWYYVWLCAGTTGVGAVISTSSSAPTLPSGYDDYKRRIGAVRTDGSSDLRRQRTIPGGGCVREVRYTAIAYAAPYLILDEVNLGNGSGAANAVDCSPLVPASSTWVVAMIQVVTPSGAAAVTWEVNSLASVLFGSILAGHSFWTPVTLELNSSQAAAVFAGANDEDFSFSVMGYLDNLLPDILP